MQYLQITHVAPMSRADAIRAANTRTVLSVHRMCSFVANEKFHLSKNDAEDRKEIVAHLQPSAGLFAFVCRSFIFIGAVFRHFIWLLCFFFVFAECKHTSRDYACLHYDDAEIFRWEPIMTLIITFLRLPDNYNALALPMNDFVRLKQHQK